MAEIKSALDIALERAAAICGRDDSDLEQLEAVSGGKLLARRVLTGGLSAQGLEAELAQIAPRVLPEARKAAAAALLEEVPDSWGMAAPALELLAAQAGLTEQLSQLSQAVDSIQQARAQAEMVLADELRGEYQKLGISGDAVSPNPQAHPEYEPRTKAALRQASLRLDAVINQLSEKF